MREPAALGALDLTMAAARGLGATVIAVPWLTCLAEALGPQAQRWPGVTPLLAVQLAGATLALATLLTAVRASLAGSRRPRRRLTSPDRCELVALGVLLGLAAGSALAQAAHVQPPLTLCLAVLPAIAGGALAGGLVWRGDLAGGAVLGWVAASLGMLGALGATLFAGALGTLSGLSADVVQAGLASAGLGGSYLAAAWAAGAIAATDPLIDHSLLERSGNPG